MRDLLVKAFATSVVLGMLTLLLPTEQASAAHYWRPFIDPDESCTLDGVRWGGKAWDRTFRCAEKCLRTEAKGNSDGSCRLDSNRSAMDSRLAKCLDKALERYLVIVDRLHCAEMQNGGTDIAGVVNQAFSEGLTIAQAAIDTISATNVGNPKCTNRAVKKSGTLVRQSGNCVLTCLRITYAKRHVDGIRHEPDGPCKVIDPTLDSKTAGCMERAEVKYRRAAAKGACATEIELRQTVEALIDEARQELQTQIERLTMGVMNEPIP